MQRKRKDAAASMGNLKTGDSHKIEDLNQISTYERRKQTGKFVNGGRKKKLDLLGDISRGGGSRPPLAKNSRFFQAKCKKYSHPLKKAFYIKSQVFY